MGQTVKRDLSNALRNSGDGARRPTLLADDLRARALRILLVEDSAGDAESIEQVLSGAGVAFETRRVETEAALRGTLAQWPPDIILSDYQLRFFDGLAALAVNRELCPGVPFVFVAASLGEEMAIKCIKRGARDCVLMNNLARLPYAIERALREAGERNARLKAEQELRHSERRNRLLARLVEQTREHVISTDLNGVVCSWNRAAETLYGYSAQEAVGRSLRALHLAHVCDAEFTEVLSRIRSGKDYTVERVRMSRSGRPLHIQSSHTPLFDDNDTHVGQVSIGRDISDRQLQEQRIARLSRIQAVTSAINAAMVRLRVRKDLFAEACRVASEHGGFPIVWIGTVDAATQQIVPVAMAGTNSDAPPGPPQSFRVDLVAGQGTVERAIREQGIAVDNDIAATPTAGYSRIAAVRRGFRSVVSVPFIGGGRIVAIMVLYATERDFFDAEEIRLLQELAADVSFALEYIDKEEKLNHLAFYDSLTGLPNRNLYLDRLRQRISVAQGDARALGVVMLDLERFRAVNGVLGRAAGDELIKAFARRLQICLPDPDVVARVGGDQFAVVFQDVRDASDVARRLDQQITAALAAPVTVAGRELALAWKAGVAVFPADGTDCESLLASAEHALKSAKSLGERRRFFAPQMGAQVAERLELESRLRRALANHEFVLHYQPKVGLASNRIEGVEGLIRWVDPRRGLVPPKSFIPILEETGMIVDVGLWVIEEAQAQYRRWLAKGLRAPRIAVNVSPFQLQQSEFVNLFLERVGSEGGVDIEITETLLMQDIDHALPKLVAMKQAGIGIAIDDFGTGYSSLGYLTKLPMDTLKIDRGFVNDMLDSEASMSVVSTIIQMAQCLNLKLVAEGVETEAQKDVLLRLDCHQMQGYLFSAPVSGTQLESLL